MLAQSGRWQPPRCWPPSVRPTLAVTPHPSRVYQRSLAPHLWAVLHWPVVLLTTRRIHDSAQDGGEGQRPKAAAVNDVGRLQLRVVCQHPAVALQRRQVTVLRRAKRRAEGEVCVHIGSCTLGFHHYRVVVVEPSCRKTYLLLPSFSRRHCAPRNQQHAMHLVCNPSCQLRRLASTP